MMYRFICLIALLSTFCKVSGQTNIGLREMTHYEKTQYNAGAQNWSIRQDLQGRIYFANNEGLLCFDGVYWKLYPLPNKTIVRSIEFGKDGRIYIGAQDEIGYFSRDKGDRLSYTSLMHLVPPADRKFADIWQLVAFGDELFFRGSEKILRYTNNQISVFQASTTWFYLGIANDQLLAQDEKLGLLLYKNGSWEPFVPFQQLPAGFHILDIAGMSGDTCLLTTHHHGIYQLAGNRLTPFLLSGMPIDLHQPFSGIRKIDDTHFIAGTYFNGFYLINDKGTVLENFSKKEGLQNSNIRSLFCDRNQNIWLGLDNGIDFIAFNNAIKHINPPLMNDGAGYAVISYQNNLYFGLSNGIYQLPVPEIEDLSNARDAFTRLSEGQVWGLFLFNNELLAGADDGFYRFRNNRPEPVTRETGFWIFEPLQAYQQHPLLVAGNYLGVKLYESNGDQLIDRGKIGDFKESARYLVVDKNNTIWVSHPYRGVYRMEHHAGADSPVKLYTAENGLPSTLNNHVFRVKNRTVIATEKGVYEYNAQTDRFEPSAYFKDIFGENSVRYLKEDPAGNVWFVQEKNIGVVDFSTIKPAIIFLPELKGKIRSGFEHVYPINENNIFVGGEKGFYHINYEKYKRNNHPLKVYIRTVRSLGKTDSLLFGGYSGNVNEDKAQEAAAIPRVSHHSNSFHIEYASPLFEQQANIEYSYFLDGFDEGWSSWSKKTEKDYTNLPAGNYTFRVKARNNLNNESSLSNYSFSVLPPWYLSVVARIAYLLLAIWLTWFVYKQQQKKLVRERQKHQEEQKRQAYLHQLELEKSEKEVVKLRNEKLESEIQFKNTELASTAMHLVQKEEFLVKIKEELQQLNRNGVEKAETGELKKILRILSEEGKLNEEWEQFSLHFDKVHSDFLMKLKERFPDLRPHELKLCAYLRMNMSSKEIARLMSISVRGVEISRYRLRKKLQLPTEANLFQYLFDLQRSDFS
ncbi:MAG: triple tyrosine motif-containing protein [Candidatus Pseudobacter hemicellulosilyticus]|uniref:Triple tyrosine motif-containing protein n=1 Tax=Candidatus Pseudobacter hemicellulosilyticus TaxID=3121375 RepID=A0AAJ5WPJ1_9BACT|nr:MAG: triple tyrosine motif-containing protein [Pseudobacter sp.]